MSTFITEGGPFMYLILALGAVAAVLAVLRAVRIGRGALPSPEALNTVLYLGVAAVVFGVTAQLTGLYMAASAILRATAISPAIIAQGVLVSFNTTLLGLNVFAVILLLWLGLRAWAGIRRRAATH